MVGVSLGERNGSAVPRGTARMGKGFYIDGIVEPYDVLDYTQYSIWQICIYGYVK